MKLLVDERMVDRIQALIVALKNQISELLEKNKDGHRFAAQANGRYVIAYL